MANETAKLDVILGGHSHSQTENNFTQNGVLIAMAGRDLQKIGKVHLRYRNGRIIEKISELIDLNSIPEKDTTISSLISNYTFMYLNP